MAAGCESGKYAAVACDGRLTYGAQADDVFAPKMQWFRGVPKDPTPDSRAIPVDWLFMLAGVLSSADLVINEVRQDLFNIPEQDPLSPANVKATLRRAFDARVKNWCAIRHLSMFGMNMDEFRERGRNLFGPKLYEKIYTRIRDDAAKYFQDEVMVIGWGLAPHAIILYAVDAYGDYSGDKVGVLAIGSGKNAATSTAVKLDHGLHSSLQDTIYSIAAAKFSAEGRLVGKDTILCVLHKRAADESGPPQIFVEQETINKLRTIWQKHNTGGIPDEARLLAAKVVELTKDEQVIARGSAQLLESVIKQSIPKKSKGRQ
jgi:hypothetical protein